ncbi:MAG: zf-HC2 domain-containing protein [Bacteroidetes bacterium]|nr:zf-HC2 domain-containing protein [Bacteroidota bacterium]
MRAHGRNRLLLYEYVMGDLDTSQRDEVKRHVEQCQECAATLEMLRKTCELLEWSSVRPSQERSEQHWDAFAANIVAQLPATKRKPLHSPQILIDRVSAFVTTRPRFALGAGIALAAAVVAIVVFRPAAPIAVDPQPEVLTTQQPGSDRNTQRLSNYLRQSRALLVGLTNMDIPDQRPMDLEPERLASRRLLEQSRYLRLQPLDAQSAGLVNDVERIMIELANMKNTGPKPDLRLIQNGIRQRNLLFKVRMAEQAYTSNRFVHASDRR